MFAKKRTFNDFFKIFQGYFFVFTHLIFVFHSRLEIGFHVGDFLDIFRGT